MVEFFGGHVYQQTFGIPMDTNCATMLADLFLYSYEAEFVQHLQKSKFKKQNDILQSHFSLYRCCSIIE